MRMRLRVLAVVAALLPIASCASIPERSDPTPVKPVLEGDASTPVTPPPRNLDSFGLVRNFVNTAAAPENNHKTARLHLTPSLRAKWQVPQELLILDNVDTIPVRRGPGTPDEVQTVRLKADRVGHLKADQSFVPESGEYSADFRLRRGPDGEWRMTTPPPKLIATRASFEQQYTPVQVYFLDHNWSGVVPDRRYVVSEPTPNLPRRVIDLLMMGPSQGFRSSMDTAIPRGVYPKTNPSEAADGALVVNLSDLKGASKETRRLIAAQVVLSLQDVSSARVRLLEEDAPMLPEAGDLRPTDVKSYQAENVASPYLSGLAIVDEQVLTLDQEAEPVPGSAGSGALDVVRAGQSADGSRLAAVVRTPTGVSLQVGPFGGRLAPVGVDGADMTAPTWRDNSELWTVVNGHDLVRVLDNGGTWSTHRVDTQEFSHGLPIQALRLSPDGTRVAGIVGGRVVVAGVRDEDGVVTLERPATLTGSPMDSELTAVEWLTNGSLVATTGSNTAPVVEISVDGYSWKWYASANLVQPLTGLAVSPTHEVVVVDGNGLWKVRGPNDLWSFMRIPVGAGSRPFYPG